MSRLPANVCSEHPNAILIEDARAGDIICSECGLVVGDRVIDVTSEWRTFANDEGKDRSRVGAAQSSLLNSSDLTTVMQNPGGKNGYDIGNSSLMKGGRRGAQTDTAEDRYLKNGYSEITKFCDRGKLTKNIHQTAKEIFHKIAETKILKGKKVAAIAAASIFIACRQNQVARSFKEVCAFTGIKVTDLSKCYNKIIKNIDEFNHVNNKQSGADDYMGRYVSQLGLQDQRLVQCGKNLSSELNRLSICEGKSPLSLTAACLYMAFHVHYGSNYKNEIKPLREICKIVGVAEATVKNIYRLIAESGRIDEMIPDYYKPQMAVPASQMLRGLL